VTEVISIDTATDTAVELGDNNAVLSSVSLPSISWR
jgi:hypothetical protein